ncbi:MAG: caspase family protein [Saprospiraceae bacterium]
MDEPTKGAGFATPPPTTAVPRGKKILLGIGINAYRSGIWPKLNNAVRDVEAVEKLLRDDYDFDETVLLRDDEATSANIEEALYRYTDEHVLGTNDSLLIYYSGHGHLDRNERGYWVPVDAQQDRIASYIPNSRIRELIADMKCRHVLLVSDACFSGALFVKGVRSSASEMVAEEYEKRPSRWAFCSGRHDEQVSDGKPGGHSPFATAILQELALNTARKLNIARLADKVIEITRANYRQMPEANPIQDAGHKGGQFVFTPKAFVQAEETEGHTGDRSYLPRFEDVKPKVFWKQPTVWLTTAVVLTALLLVALLYPWPPPEPTTTTLVLSKNAFVLDTMELGTPATIRFEVKNTGQIEARLLHASHAADDMRQLEGGGDQPIPPGGSRVFTFEWKPKGAGNRSFQIGIEGLNTIQKHLTVRGQAYVREKPTVAVQEEPADKPTSTKISTKPTKPGAGGSVSTKPPPQIEQEDPPPAARFDTVYTRIPLDVELWLEPDGGEPIYAKTIKGKQAFVLPKGIKGREHKVYFKQKDKEDWRRQPVSTSGIKLPW